MSVTLEMFGPAFVLASLVATVAASRGLHRRAVAGIAAIAFGAAFVPIGGLNAAAYALGFPGPLSAATLVMAAQWPLRTLGAGSRVGPSTVFLSCIAISGLVLYPAAAGFVAFDVYDLGFRGLAIPALMTALVVTGWLSGANDVPIWVAVAALLYLFGAYASVNLWDYLIDPVAFVVALIALAVRAWRWRRWPLEKR